MTLFARLFGRKTAALDGATLERLRAKELLGGNVVVKEIVRNTGKERVRIFERSNHTFGIIVQHQPDDTDAWFTSNTTFSGAAFDSVATAEREAAVVIPCRANKVPNQPPEPTR